MAEDVQRQETMTGCSQARDSNARADSHRDLWGIVKYSIDISIVANSWNFASSRLFVASRSFVFFDFSRCA